jgi:hypothetical protein
MQGHKPSLLVISPGHLIHEQFSRIPCRAQGLRENHQRRFHYSKLNLAIVDSRCQADNPQRTNYAQAGPSYGNYARVKA